MNATSTTTKELLQLAALRNNAGPLSERSALHLCDVLLNVAALEEPLDGDDYEARQRKLIDDARLLAASLLDS